VPPKRVLLTMLALILLLHMYIGLRLLPALETWRIGVPLLGLSTLLVPCGLLARALPGTRFSDMVSWVGLTIMGLFSSLLCLTVVRDLALLLLRLVAPDTLSAFFGPSAQAVLALAGMLTVWGLFNARRSARIVDVDIPLADLPPALHGFTIVQISDIHVGPTIKRGFLQQIVARVNHLDADLIAVTGDMVDGSVHRLAAHTAPLAGLRARHGAFFVTGNHEYYAGAREWIAEFKRLGLTVLENRHVVLTHEGADLLLAGVTDYSAHHFADGIKSDPHAALADAPSDVAVKVLLAHQPRSAFAAAEAGFDLQLSGHTHGGQFLPWNWFVRFQQPFTAGLHRMQGLWVYTSRGTGYWGPPKRVFAPSEITRVRLVCEGSLE